MAQSKSVLTGLYFFFLSLFCNHVCALGLTDTITWGGDNSRTGYQTYVSLYISDRPGQIRHCLITVIDCSQAITIWIQQSSVVQLLARSFVQSFQEIMVASLNRSTRNLLSILPLMAYNMCTWLLHKTTCRCPLISAMRYR